MLNFAFKTNLPLYEIIGNRMIFLKELNEPFENYHCTILNYPSLSVHFSRYNHKHLALTKNINCIVTTFGKSISIFIFPKHMMYASITLKMFNSFHCSPNKYMKRLFLNAHAVLWDCMNLPKNMTFFQRIQTRIIFWY